MKNKLIVMNIVFACILFFLIVIVKQLYVFHYNKGNKLYEKKLYNEAIKEYNIALEMFPPKYKECSIRINLSLSILQEIEKCDVSTEKIKILNILNKAEAILLEDGCANKNDHNGHSKEAEQLKDDIENMKKQVIATYSQENSDENDDEKNKSQDNNTDNENNKDKENIEKRIEELRELQEKSLQIRNENEENDLKKYNGGKEFNGEVFYKGIIW